MPKATGMDIPIEYGNELKFLLRPIRRGNPGNEPAQFTLTIRCLDCNWGYNCKPTFVSCKDLEALAQQTTMHARECKNTGRTIDIDSLRIG